MIRTTLRGDDKNKDIDAFVRRPLLPLCKRIAARPALAPLAAPLFRAGVVASSAAERLGNTRTNSAARSLCLAIVKGASCARAVACVRATYPHRSPVLLIYLICLFSFVIQLRYRTFSARRSCRILFAGSSRCHCRFCCCGCCALAAFLLPHFRRHIDEVLLPALVIVSFSVCTVNATSIQSQTQFNYFIVTRKRAVSQLNAVDEVKRFIGIEH